jgi:hypothetical protein
MLVLSCCPAFFLTCYLFSRPLSLITRACFRAPLIARACFRARSYVGVYTVDNKSPHNKWPLPFFQVTAGSTPLIGKKAFCLSHVVFWVGRVPQTCLFFPLLFCFFFVTCYSFSRFRLSLRSLTGQQLSEPKERRVSAGRASLLLGSLKSAFVQRRYYPVAGCQTGTPS